MNRNKVVRQILNYVAEKKYGLPYKKLGSKRASLVRKSAAGLVKRR
jgi:hypothetical protein